MNGEQLDILILRHLDGALNAEESARLSEILEADAVARERLRSMAEQAFAVGEAGRCREARLPMRALAGELFDGRVPRWGRRWIWTAAAALVMAGLFFVFQQRATKPLLEVVAVRGAATWSDGGQRLPLAAGMKVAAGTLETESETATAEVRFADGTRFTLNGGAEAVFSDDGGKQVLLKRGSFTASVAKQGHGRPMRARTATAEVEVLGTVFTLDAMPQHTDLSVAEGRVRLKRLVDGRAVEVSARQRTTASLVATDELVAVPLRVPATEWHLDLSNAPRRLTGVWQAATEGGCAWIAATPTVERCRPDGGVLVHQSVIVRAASNSPADAFAVLTDESVLRVKLRLKRAFPLQLMISTRRPDGGFAGNLELVKQHPELAGDGRWHTLDVPFKNFAPLSPECARLAGLQVNVVIITTLHEPVGLEVAEISILPTARKVAAASQVQCVELVARTKFK